MRIRRSALAACLLCVLGLNGCVKTQYTETLDLVEHTNSLSYNSPEPVHKVICYITEVSNLGVSIPSEYSSIWNQPYFQSDTVDQNVKITFDGVEYEGEYRRSLFEDHNPFATDLYRGEGGEIGLNADSGELTQISLYTNDFLTRELTYEDLKNPEEDSLTIAEAYAGRYVELSEYTLYQSPHPSKPRIYQPENATEDQIIQFYIYDFVRYINGLPTSDYISIRVTSKGHFVSMIMGATGVFTQELIESNVIASGTIDDQQMAEAKAKAVLPDMVSFEITNTYLAVTPEGEVVLNLITRCKRENGDTVGFKMVLVQEDT